MSKRKKNIKIALLEIRELVAEEKYTVAFNQLFALNRQVDNSADLASIARLQIECLMKTGNVQEANRLVGNLAKTEGDRPEVAFVLAQHFEQIENYAQAQTMYLRATVLAPANIEHCLAFSAFLQKNGEYKRSIQLVHKCLRLNRQQSSANPDLPLLYIDLARIYFQTRQYRRSVILLLASTDYPDFDDYYLLAESCLCLNQTSDALNYCNREIAQNGENNATVLFLKAKILTSLGKEAEAMKLLRKCRKIWGELVIRAYDLMHLYPLVQNGKIHQISKTTLSL